MSHERIDLRTEDGTCPAHVFSPETPGRWPGVLFFMDGIGIRPALFEMGERMASAGYHVLLPDLYYRTGLLSGRTAVLRRGGSFSRSCGGSGVLSPER
ncbi:MAG: dienelactone hydrolase family protein, partial [Gemmatimonadaceae bacterium]|nr:dienelactone hydrolase family protein [Gemmatimonadaceae bacterium]